MRSRIIVVVSLCAAGVLGLGPAPGTAPALANALGASSIGAGATHVVVESRSSAADTPLGPRRTTSPATVAPATTVVSPSAPARPAGADTAPQLRSLAGTAAGSPTAPLPRPPVHTDARRLSGPWLGVLEPDGSHSPAERAAGMTVVDFELHWRAYEPTQGVVDPAYVAQMRGLLNSFRAAGMQVILQPGIEDAPAWVYNLDGNTRFVNQYGDVFMGDGEGPVANAVFDAAVQRAQQAYIAQIATDFGDAWFGVRVGGLQYGELKYPANAYNGHVNSYWAFDGAAQAGSPVPGWRPGQADPAKATAFLDYYLQKLTNYQNLLLTAYRSHFSGWLYVLYPSWGLRPGEIQAAAATDLNGSTPTTGWNSLAYGVDWARQVNSITVLGTVAYTTWLERGDDSTTDPVHMSPLRYLAMLAHGHGLPVAGENAQPGVSGAALTDLIRRVLDVRAVGVMWFFEPSLVAAGGAGLRTLGAATTWSAAAPSRRTPQISTFSLQRS
jgi:hypothetical protein